MPPIEPRITEVTLRRITDMLTLEGIWWWGTLNEVTFLERLCDLDALRSDDPRFTTARQDIAKHCLDNDDWEAEWVFTDDRFSLNSESPEPLLAFLAEMVHPVVRRDRDEVQRLVRLLNEILAADGFELSPARLISGHPLCTREAPGWPSTELVPT